MEISEVRIKLMDAAQERLLGFCSITFDHAFVIRDLKIIKGGKGAFVAMPSRKLTDRCPACSNKNPLRACYCSQCGTPLEEDRSLRATEGRTRLYADIAHPIHAECRDMIQRRVMQAYEEELILARQPGYVCRYDDFGELDFEPGEQERWEEPLIPVPNGTVQRRWDQPESRSSGPHESRGELHRPATSQRSEFGDGLF
jgi:stage V sporulation protein G